MAKKPVSNSPAADTTAFVKTCPNGPSVFQQASHVESRFMVQIPDGDKLDDICKPSYWAHHAARVTPKSLLTCIDQRLRREPIAVPVCLNSQQELPSQLWLVRGCSCSRQPSMPKRPFERSKQPLDAQPLMSWRTTWPESFAVRRRCACPAPGQPFSWPRTIGFPRFPMSPHQN